MPLPEEMVSKILITEVLTIEWIPIILITLDLELHHLEILIQIWLSHHKILILQDLEVFQDKNQDNTKLQDKSLEEMTGEEVLILAEVSDQEVLVTETHQAVEDLDLPEEDIPVAVDLEQEEDNLKLRLK